MVEKMVMKFASGEEVGQWLEAGRRGGPGSWLSSTEQILSKVKYL